ncbi:hypothetical protein MHBO_001560 [Bonamia ostreae]|uniref:60S acidic ribosomal protein P2 n=1 Tax=Bonamia ostreae TaxID=126728 RepID=A0ABV2AJF2_9EUKA
MTNAFENIDSLKDNDKKLFSCLLSALILADDNMEATEDKISSILKASGSDADAIFANIVAESLKGKDVKELAMQGGVFGGSAPAAATESAEEKKNEEEEEKEEEAGENVEGFGDLFGSEEYSE